MKAYRVTKNVQSFDAEGYDYFPTTEHVSFHATREGAWKKIKALLNGMENVQELISGQDDQPFETTIYDCVEITIEE